MILDSKNIKYDMIDITEPGRESDKEFMQNKSTSNGATVSDPEPRHALPPQIFNEEEYCGDYDAFDLANEIDTLEQFLKVAPPVDTTAEVSSAQQENGDAKPANGEEGENKENEGEQSADDKTVKDGENAGDGENAEV